MAIVYPHDIVKVKEGVSLDTLSLPNWAYKSWQSSPYHVIRRAPIRDKMIPIGIRGTTRGERYGCYIPITWVEKIISPQSLVAERAWHHWQRATSFPRMFDAIERMSHILMDIKWGIGGSIGYELTTGLPTITEQSDLDIILYPTRQFSTQTGTLWQEEAQNCTIKVDIQVETSQGAFHLVEYLSGRDKILLKRVDGYILSNRIW